MSKNIKDIGKELMGKSLNSFHRKTGLTQLEKNNEMQDGILNGILSQVDDAYIEKTEQSNVMHLDGSGDGLVVLDSIEGNTMVNLWDFNKVEVTGQATKTNNTIKIITTDNRWSNFFMNDKGKFKPSTDYTFIIDVKKNTLTENSVIAITSLSSGDNRGVFETYNIRAGATGKFIKKLRTIEDFSLARYGVRSFFDNVTQTPNCEVELNMIILEGDWTNKEIPCSYFESLQSSFEEQVEGDKYKIEILANNKNLCLEENIQLSSYRPNSYEMNKKGNSIFINNKSTEFYREFANIFVKIKEGSTYKVNYNNIGCLSNYSNFDPRVNFVDENKNIIGTLIYGDVREKTYNAPIGAKYLQLQLRFRIGTPIGSGEVNDIIIYEEKDNGSFIEPKSNKIKILLNEPLRAIGNKKDKLCIRNNKLIVERNVAKFPITSNIITSVSSSDNSTFRFNVYKGTNIDNIYNISWDNPHLSLCNVLPYKTMWTVDEEGFYIDVKHSSDDSAKRNIVFRVLKTKVNNTIDGLNSWLDNGNLFIVYALEEPYYEEVLNEYGEPIILEGYENGTLYIDSTIVPTTTIRYTPKMESLNVLSEVTESNEALTLDMNENIIPYMMDVDMLITEKEMSAISTYSINNIRKMEELDMTSMQKRTFDMLERLIRGDQYKKEYTKEEMINRVLLYENAGRITTEQALELNLIIEEVYGSN